MTSPLDERERAAARAIRRASFVPYPAPGIRILCQRRILPDQPWRRPHTGGGPPPAPPPPPPPPPPPLPAPSSRTVFPMGIPCFRYWVSGSGGGVAFFPA